MEGLEQRVAAAAESRDALNELLRDYLPFLKKLAAQRGMDYDDCLSLAMIAFTDAVRQYVPERGSFLSYAQACIRNRITDEFRRQRRYESKILPLDGENELPAPDTCDRALERKALSEEIAAFNQTLSDCGVVFAELPKICPSQQRSRLQCLQLAACITADPLLRQDFQRSRRLPQGELARRFRLSVKTVEKHRKYIVALTVILLGDYPGIRAFLPKGKDVML